MPLGIAYCIKVNVSPIKLSLNLRGNENVPSQQYVPICKLSFKIITPPNGHTPEIEEQGNYRQQTTANKTKHINCHCHCQKPINQLNMIPET